ncbi:hypothetical protein BGW80DRAFT_1250620 [Lactifluus volemus]|nr:hypothetical protein BGW80DRAFT_1250620 [Lactifluus volemus]
MHANEAYIRKTANATTSEVKGTETSWPVALSRRTSGTGKKLHHLGSFRVGRGVRARGGLTLTQRLDHAARSLPSEYDEGEDFGVVTSTPPQVLALLEALVVVSRSVPRPSRGSLEFQEAEIAPLVEALAAELFGTGTDSVAETETAITTHCPGGRMAKLIRMPTRQCRQRGGIGSRNCEGRFFAEATRQGVCDSRQPLGGIKVAARQWQRWTCTAGGGSCINIKTLRIRTEEGLTAEVYE